MLQTDFRKERAKESEMMGLEVVVMGGQVDFAVIFEGLHNRCSL